MAPTSYEIVPAEEWHIHSIAKRVRFADVLELHDVANSTPISCMQQGMRDSVECYTALVNGLPLCMFGVVPITQHMGLPWLVGTMQLDHHAKWFLQESKPTLERMFARWTVLMNHVDSRNKRAIRWLRWLGFEFLEPVPMGVQGIPFIPFIMRRDHV